MLIALSVSAASMLQHFLQKRCKALKYLGLTGKTQPSEKLVEKAELRAVAQKPPQMPPNGGVELEMSLFIIILEY